ncbi:uncharacterized protein LOC127526605 [Erpetoichthys calabaricus]|uniref:uncharacterized protein LOC127526605 n=1 Tax=Erpetoichthys calabaricus TaxID=27687 RepID=UPI0022345A50|nr:uncharacterized protein LOC127526605 [Erpetoichthys calabaricus]
MELEAASTSQSATSGGPVPSQRSQPTADPGKQPSQMLSVARRELLLPEGWRTSLPKEQHVWVSQVLFTRGKDGKPTLTSNLRLWWFPPGPPNVHLQPPTSPDTFFQRPFFLWMPYRMWGYKLSCTACSHRLSGAGLYRTVRRVLDTDGWYFMATEYLECRRCRKKVAGWSRDVLDQLHHTHWDEFPAILTYRLSCDKKLIGQMRDRTLDNGANRLRRYLLEEHTRSWILHSKSYLFAFAKFITSGAEPFATPPLPPRMTPVPSAKWLLSVYAREVALRLEETKARITSIFGSILKMDSTKKVTKKLAGAAAGTAAWVTNVENEHGQILISVLTAAKGAGLHPMATGLMQRYRDASVSPPLVLYVNRDCCSHGGPSKVSLLFHQWDQLVVRLDVWHLMRRFAAGVTTESHPLYSLFMARLSFCIFEWDQGDVAQLRQAKAGEVGKGPRGSGYGNIPLKELARHCRRRTRGAEETGRLIDEMLEAFGDATDTMGVPLLDRDKIQDIWKTQRRHLHCIQDPPGVHLYMQTGRLVKGGITLPVFRCARGTTSLESFHLHLDRFIPGTSASAAHFQAYLLEGLARWNEDRAAQAVGAADRDVVCYNGQLQHSVNELSEFLYHIKLVEDYTQPAK